MQLFGRKAKEQSGTPSEVPPELQPYYGKPSLWSRIRRVLPVVTLVLIIAAIGVAAALWWRHEHPAKAPGTQTATNQPKPSAPSSQTPSPTSPSTPQPQQPTPAAPNPAAPSTPQAQPTAPPQQPGTIPNTGPGTGALLAALGTGVAGVMLHYGIQLRRLRSSQR